MLDVLSPSNFVLTNTEILERTQATGGMNLVKGYWNLLESPTGLTLIG